MFRKFSKARIEAGAAKSVSEAARQLADETGKKTETIRREINMGARELGTVSQLSELTGPLKREKWLNKPNNQQPEPAETLKKGNAPVLSVTDKTEKPHNTQTESLPA